MTSNPFPGPGPRPLSPVAERALLACGVAGPLLFVLTFVLLGATREQYDPLRHPVSSLAIGTGGWMQVVNFLVTGTLLIAFAEGLRRGVRREGGGVWLPVLVALVGVGLVGAGVFVADPISGYPPGTPPVADEPTTHGALHQLLSSLVFLGIPLACAVAARRSARRGRTRRTWYSILSGLAFLACFVLSSVGFSQNAALMPVGGLLQRAALVVGLLWIAVTALDQLASEPHGHVPLAAPSDGPRNA